jgi:hypothetical protein
MAKDKSSIIDVVPDGLAGDITDVKALVQEFLPTCDPLERDRTHVLVDARTNARYCECHMRAEKIIALSTVDVPLDPEEQPDYRANRELVEDHVAFQAMKDDARQRRTFSNIVAEYTTSFEPQHPIKIIGGQHRFMAIKEAIEHGVNEYHGLKVYFGLNPDQRLDVQLISNTNIAVSTDLFDRMQETLAGPELRQWCQEVGLLDQGTDFADRRQRGRPITVKAARTFIVNYFRGAAVDPKRFDQTDTTPTICRSGVPDADWETLKRERCDLWQHAALNRAGKEFAMLIQSQREAFAATGRDGRVNVDFGEKASNFAVLAAWAYVAGLLSPNETRLKRHYALRDQKSRDPLNAGALAKGRHKTDPENYRGLGYRTDAKERGRFVELFALQAEKGGGIDRTVIDIAIKKYHAKQAVLEALEAEQKATASWQT